MEYYIGIDLGGTNIVAGVVNQDLELMSKATVKTNLPQTAVQIVDSIETAIRSVLKTSQIRLNQIKNIGIGSPGVANKSTGIVDYSNNLNFYDVPLQKMIEQRMEKPVFIENDANAAALGEFTCGAGKGSNNMIVVTLGTGIGGGIIIDKKLYTGFNFAAAELGHMVIRQNGRQCTCGRKGCFETYASATGLIQSTREKMLEHQDSKLWKISPTLDKVSGKTAFDAFKMSDKAAIEVISQYIGDLACGLTNIVNIFQPEIFCIGGGISQEGEILFEPLRRMIGQEEYGRHCKDRTVFKPAKLGNDAGVIGAALLSLSL